MRLVPSSSIAEQADSTNKRNESNTEQCIHQFAKVSQTNLEEVPGIVCRKQWSPRKIAKAK
jgi:hypothetical protein